MTAPDRIQITHRPRTMTTPRAALTSDDIPPGPLSEDDLRRGWNQQADEHNQWESLDSCEQLAWAQALAIKADRHAAALKAEPETAVEALAARPLIERLAQLRNQGFLGVRALANQAAMWLRENPPGQPVAIEPRGCPTPGACSCVEITPPSIPANYIDPEHTGRDRELLQAFYRACAAEGGTADEIHLRGIKAVLGLRCAPPSPEPGEGRWTEGVCGDGAAILFDGAMVPVEEVVRALNGRPATPPAPEPGEVATAVQWLLSMRELAGEHNPEERRQFTRAATLLQRQEAELAALRGVPVAVSDRLPGEEDLHPEGKWCWGWKYDRYWAMMRICCFGGEPDPDKGTHWRPWNAIPLPAPQGEIASSPTSTEARDPDCMARWPECEVGGYDPRCCRFPKSCSCWIVPATQAGEVEA